MSKLDTEEKRNWHERVSRDRRNKEAKFLEQFSALPTPESTEAIAQGATSDDVENYFFAHKVLGNLAHNGVPDKRVDYAGLVLIRDALKSKLKEAVKAKIKEMMLVVNEQALDPGIYRGTN